VGTFLGALEEPKRVYVLEGDEADAGKRKEEVDEGAYWNGS